MKRIFRFLSLTLCCSVLFPLASLSAPLRADSDSPAMTKPEGFHSLGGNWTFGDTVTSVGSGDVFALSSTEATRFVYEAKATFHNRTGAVSLVFYASDDPSRGAYVANVDIGAGNARIFRFEASGGATTKGEYRLTPSEMTKSEFHLRVEADGDAMAFYLDNKPIVTLNDPLPKPGKKLGLLTYNTSASYCDVKCFTKTADFGLSSLTTPSETLYGSPVMKTRLGYGVETAVFTADATGSLEARVHGASAEAEVVGNEIRVTKISESFILSVGVTSGGVTRQYALCVTVENDPDRVYHEEWRPQLHWTPFVNFNNDPNGLVYDPSNQTYHMFFQYNPFGMSIGNQVWGHAISTDLVHWKEVDIAIPQDHLGAVFSGSCVVDENNTTGFFTDNKPGESKLVALFTSDGGDTAYGHEKQCIAYSKDHGMTWIRPSLEREGFENPVLGNENNKYGRDFRDPKIFWYDGRWFMVVAGGRARLFTSPDLIHWTLVCDMGFDSECPDFYPLALDGDENNIKWIYNASGRWYTVGRLEKVSETSYRYIPETERILYNGGGEVYATQSFYNDGSGKNRRIAISWLQDNSAHLLEGKTWNGAMTLPYEETLRTVNGKLTLLSYPVSEIETIRKHEIFSLTAPTADALDRALRQNPSAAYELLLTLRPKANAVLTLSLRKGLTVETRVIYDASAGMLRVIRSKASEVAGVPSGTMEMPLSPDENGTVTLRIVMDTNVIEVFGNEGEAALCGMIFPGSTAVGSSLTLTGECAFDSAVMYAVGSIWHGDEPVLPEAGIYFEVGAGYIPLDGKTYVTAYEIDANGKRVDQNVILTLNETDRATAEINGATATLVGVKAGSVTLTAKSSSWEKTLTLRVADIGFSTDLEGWTSAGDWFIGENGYGLSGASDNSFTFADRKNEGDFLFSGKADLLGKGGCLGLVFAASHPEKPINGYWYGANIDTHGSQPVMKLFFNNRGNEVWSERASVTLPESGVYELSVRYADGVLTFTVNGVSVTHAVRNLPSGALGLVSWNGGGAFDGVTYRSLDENGGEILPPVTDTPETTDTPVTDAPATDTPETTDTPVTDAPATDTPDRNKGGAALGIVLGSLGVLCAVGGAVYFLWKRKKT
ncbi:MAG: glycoside hydrolase family 32 protein [Clostridia bacterium]|nr:glycoside hydrolase family 32 protein [Clostridia bacterium]